MKKSIRKLKRIPLFVRHSDHGIKPPKNMIDNMSKLNTAFYCFMIDGTCSYYW